MTKRLRALAWAAVFSQAVSMIGMQMVPSAQAQEVSHTQKIERVNANTVSIVSGNINGTYLALAYDLSAVLDDGDNLRVMPVIGKGGRQNLEDVLYLKGVDMGITESNIGRIMAESGVNIDNFTQRVHYIAKLCNDEYQLLARADIQSIEDLRGKRVNFSDANSASQLMARLLFKDLGITVEEVAIGQGDALVKMHNGEIAATFIAAGKPVMAFRALNNVDGFHFLPVSYSPQMSSDYFPAQLNHDDYPTLIPPGEKVDTIAVGALLVVYNWPENSDRYRRMAHFVDAFYAKMDQFQKSPRHPKWKELNMTAEVPGWTRFAAVQHIIDRTQQPAQDDLKASFQAFVTELKRKGMPVPKTPQEQEALFQQFKAWQKAR